MTSRTVALYLMTSRGLAVLQGLLDRIGPDAIRGHECAAYDAPRTPLERVKACSEVDPQAVAALRRLRDRLDPFALAEAIDRKIERLVALATPARAADGPAPPEARFPLIVPASPKPRPGRPPDIPDFTFANHLRRPTLARRGLRLRWLDDLPLGIFLRWLDRERASKETRPAA